MNYDVYDCHFTLTLLVLVHRLVLFLSWTHSYRSASDSDSQRQLDSSIPRQGLLRQLLMWFEEHSLRALIKAPESMYI